MSYAALSINRQQPAAQIGSSAALSQISQQPVDQIKASNCPTACWTILAKIRERHQQRRNASPKEGQFEYTADLFANKFADLLGGQEVMGRWMKTTVPQLGNRTPEDALRLGMS